MNFRHLYNATIAKEVVSSALMAMAFESLPGFRKFMFDLIDCEDRFNLDRCEWSVGVEQPTDTGRCDILLESEQHIVIIEMKIKPGALQDSQLVKYFEHEKSLYPNRSVFAVLVSPGAVGLGEIQKVKSCKLFSIENDKALQISWNTIAQYSCLDDTEFGHAYSETLVYLKELILSQKTKKYSLEDGRGDVRDIVRLSAESLKNEYGAAHFGTFNGWDNEELYTTHSNITVSVVVTLKKDENDEKSIAHVYNDNGLISARIKFKFKLSKDGAKDKRLKQYWALQEMKFGKRIGQVNFSKLGSAWFSSELSDFEGTGDELLTLITGQASNIIYFLQQVLATQGFSFFR